MRARDGKKMLLIPAGASPLGTSESQARGIVERFAIDPSLLAIQHPGDIALPAYYIDEQEVTHADYRRFVEATGHRLPVAWVEYGYPEELARCAMIGIDYEDAQAYAAWAGKRLPSGAEWERAARGEDGRLFPWGDEWNPAACRWAGHSGPLDPRPAQVGSHPLDRSPWGVQDMGGNVAEWVSGAATTDTLAWVRGGSLAYAEPFQFFCATRNLQPRNNGAIGYIGFRCAAGATGPLAATTDWQSEPKKSVPRRVKPYLTPRSPDAAAYAKRPLQLHSVYDRDPTRAEYQNTYACCYLPDASMSERALEQPLPWKIEVRAPYFPDDRFIIFFENYWGLPMPEPVFNDDHSRLKIEGSFPGYLETSITMITGADYVDLYYDVTNIGNKRVDSSVEMCFSALNAPNFADHDGGRTYMLTERGFKRRDQLPQKIMERLWCQDFTIDEVSRTSCIAPYMQQDLIATLSRDGDWLIAPVSLSGKPVRLFNNWEYGCLHAIPYSRLYPGERRELRQRVYFLRGGLNALVSRYQQDYGQCAAGPNH